MLRNMEDHRIEYDMNVAFNIYIEVYVFIFKFICVCLC